MLEWVFLGLIFLAVFVAFFTMFQVVARRREQTQARLDEQGTDSKSDVDINLVFGDITEALAQQAPMSETKRTQIEHELRNAGYYGPTAVVEYAAVQVALILVPLILAGVACLFIATRYIPYVAAAGLAGAGLGFGFPRIYINYLARMRAREIERGLPVAVDLITLGLAAGQNILTAFQRVARELRSSFPTLALELEIVSRHADLQSLPAALRHLADRIHVQEVRTLAAILVQSEHLGTDISTTLLEFAANFRTTMRQRAEAQANRAAFWMVFPTIFCLWLPAAFLLVGPVFYDFFHRRQDVRGKTMDNRDKIQEMEQRLRRTGAPLKTGSSSETAKGQ